MDILNQILSHGRLYMQLWLGLNLGQSDKRQKSSH